MMPKSKLQEDADVNKKEKGDFGNILFMVLHIS